MRIYFEKLLNREYSIDIELEMINWFLKTGRKHNKYTSKWNLDSVSKQMFNYSANFDYYVNFPFPITENNFIGSGSRSYNVLDSFIQLCLFNAIIKKPSKPVADWRNEENVKLGKYRVLNFNTETPTIRHEKYDGYTYWNLLIFKTWIGEKLKPELFYKQYKEPFLVNILFYTNGDGYIFEYQFGFSDTFNCKWSEYIIQEKNESMRCFTNRILFQLDNIKK